jgi:two-component system chemotaxis response regulator CheB
MTDGGRIRVLVADDSATIRARFAAALATAPDIVVVGEAADGEEAVARCAVLAPDVVILDILMPRLDGVRATQEIMARFPRPILVVSASDSRRDALSSMQALAAGAVDAIEKPHQDEPDDAFDARLVRAVRLVRKIPVVTRRRVAARPTSSAVHEAPAAAIRREVVAIGGSTGGPAAVVDLLRALPTGFPLPILLVLHIGPAFGFAFAEWLNGTSKIPVVEAADALILKPGHVHVCPPDRHLIVREDMLFLTREPPRHSCRPSVDVLFESVAESYGDRAIGCLLTGIGRDGAEGLRQLRSRGALTMAQDEASCAVFGMPREAILRGAAGHVLSPPDMAALLASAARIGRAAV